MDQPTTPALVAVEQPKEDFSTFRVIIGAGVALVVVMMLMIIAFVSARVAAETITGELKMLRQSTTEFTSAFEQAKRWNEKSMGRLIDAVEQIDPMTPPTNDKLFTIMSKGLGVSENVIATGEVGTTETAAFATDLTAVQQTDAYTQEIIITNRDDTDVLCFKPIAWASAGANCAAKCAAQTITCPAVNGAGTTATDGTVTPPGSSWPRRYDGTSCICIVGSAAGTAYQTERVLRRRVRVAFKRRRFRMV